MASAEATTLRMRKRKAMSADRVGGSMQGTLPSWVGPVVVATDLALAALVAFSVARAARNTGFTRATRRRLVGSTVVVLGVWFALAAVVAAAEFSPLHPVPLGLIFGPVVVGVGLAVVSPTWRRLLDRVPQAWLVGGQAYRVIGVVFLAGWSAGVLPAYFALPAGGGDVLTGLGAVVVAALLVRGVVATRAVVAWNSFGLLDLVVAVGAGSSVLSGPLTAVFGASGVTTTAVVAFPLGLVPFFLVPLSTLLHLYSLGRVLGAWDETVTASRPSA